MNIARRFQVFRVVGYIAKVWQTMYIEKTARQMTLQTTRGNIIDDHSNRESTLPNVPDWTCIIVRYLNLGSFYQGRQVYRQKAIQWYHGFHRDK